MAQRLRALAVLPKDLDSITNSHMAAHSFSGNPTPSHRHTCKQNTNVHKIKKKKLKKKEELGGGGTV